MGSIKFNKKEYDDSLTGYFSVPVAAPIQQNNISMPVDTVSISFQAQSGSVQGTTRCPHGAPGGACPICSGQAGGGGGGGASSLKKTGMSWNEAYYAWSRIQIAKESALNSIQTANLEAMNANNKFITLINAMGFTQKLAEIQAILQQYVTTIGNNITALKNSVVDSLKSIVNVTKSIINPVKNLFTNISAVTEKLAAIFGEEIKNLREQIRLTAEKILQKLTEFSNISRLFKVFNDKRQQFAEFFTEKIKEANEKLQKIMEKLASFIKEKPDKRKKQQKDRKKRKKQETLRNKNDK